MRGHAVTRGSKPTGFKPPEHVIAELLAWYAADLQLPSIKRLVEDTAWVENGKLTRLSWHTVQKWRAAWLISHVEANDYEKV